MNTYGKRIGRLVFGLFLFSLGAFLMIRANIGLAPWDALSMGIAMRTGLSFGDVVIVTGVAVLVIDHALKEKIGVGTVLNALLIGKFLDLIEFLDVVPMMHDFAHGMVMLLIGQVVLCCGSYFYIDSGLGCGPRDALMVALIKRLPRTPLAVIRCGIEGTVLLAGWLLGAKVGMGTVLSVFGIGFVLQAVFAAFRFDVKNVEHEGLLCSLRAMTAK